VTQQSEVTEQRVCVCHCMLRFWSLISLFQGKWLQNLH